MHMVMPTQGVCPANTSPLYRVFSNRTDANHRYVNDRATRSQMLVTTRCERLDGGCQQRLRTLIARGPRLASGSHRDCRVPPISFRRLWYRCCS